MLGKDGLPFQDADSMPLNGEVYLIEVLGQMQSMIASVMCRRLTSIEMKNKLRLPKIAPEASLHMR